MLGITRLVATDSQPYLIDGDVATRVVGEVPGDGKLRGGGIAGRGAKGNRRVFQLSSAGAVGNLGYSAVVPVPTRMPLPVTPIPALASRFLNSPQTEAS